MEFDALYTTVFLLSSLALLGLPDLNHSTLSSSVTALIQSLYHDNTVSINYTIKSKHTTKIKYKNILQKDQEILMLIRKTLSKI